MITKSTSIYSITLILEQQMVEQSLHVVKQHYTFAKTAEGR